MRDVSLSRALVTSFLVLGAFAPGAGAWEVYRSESGALLRWDLDEVVLRMSPAPVGLDAARAALEGGIAAWASRCEGPAVRVTEGEGQLDGQDQNNAVVWVTSEEAWTERFPSTELARTLLTYRVQSGRLVDVDIAVNLAFHDLAAGAVCDPVRHDLQGLFAHEVGHLFGLDHSRVEGATMWFEVPPGDCAHRTLSDDDRAGYCAIYPEAPGPEVVEAEPTPEPQPEVVEAVEAEAPRDEGCHGGAGGLTGWLALCALRARRYSGR